MLDTHQRRYVQPLIDKVDKNFVEIGLSANQVTKITLIIGVMTGPLICFGYKDWAVLALWISGFSDTVEG